MLPDDCYYSDKTDTLRDIFGAHDVVVHDDHIVIDNQEFPIINDVIILEHPDRCPPAVALALSGRRRKRRSAGGPFASDIQHTFGEEWKEFARVMPEHQAEFHQYVDLIDLDQINNWRVCDLGCGMGRWSYFLRTHCREIVLVDFSEAIFVARDNLRDTTTALFFLVDLTELPFRHDFADLIVCLGVLHHLPRNALQMVRALEPFASTLLVYLYYRLDNRPFYYRLALRIVTVVRKILSRIRGGLARLFLSWLITVSVYLPLVWVGRVLSIINLGQYVPLFETYRGKSIRRIRQDAYDRFFTRIEQRYTREEILGVRDCFSEVQVSDHLPYWHFICRR